MSCPRLRGAISSFETLVKVIGFLSFARIPETVTSLSCCTFRESDGVSCAEAARPKRKIDRLKNGLLLVAL